MSYEINILNEPAYPVKETRLREAARAVLDYAGAEDTSALTLVIESDKAVARLNRQYRGVDAPTDIISFPADAPPVAIEGEPRYLGDLIIAFPYASAQAAEVGQSLDDSLALLVVHGCFHLLGYDHDTSAHKADMWSAQAAVLDALNIPADYLPALEGGTEDAGLP